ncbi:MAG: HEAT repeat domain-containing protein [Gemmatimonadales bacterium]|jgi:HEAT repeat protein
MFNPEIFAVNFGRTLELLRAPVPNKDQQKACLRAVFALTSLASATLRLYDGVLSVDDAVIPGDLPFTAGLRSQLEAHGVSEIAIVRGANPTELLTLLRALALDAGGFAPDDGVAQRLAAIGATGIAVLGARREVEEASPRAPSVTQAFELAAIEEAMAAGAAAYAPWPPVTEAPPAEPAFPPVTSAPELSSAPVFTPAASAQAPMEAESSPLPAVEPGAETTPESVAAPPTAEVPSAPPPAVEAPEELAAPHGVPPDTLVGSALGAVLRNPYGDGILDRLSEVAQEIGTTFREGRLELSVQATAALIGLEPAAPEGSARTAYGIVLRRILSRDALKEVAHLLPDPRFTPVATAVIQRGGTDGVEVLLDLLSGSEVSRERKAYLATLRIIPHGTEAVVQLLSNCQWFVVRNVAELLGEMRVEEAVPSLGGLLAHKEPRVRRAAAVALARIGTVATVEPLRRALREGTPELRGLVAASIGGIHARALAMPLVAIAEAEESGDVQAELFRALGRIGSPEAIDALVRAAQPGGRLFGRRPSGPRVAAVKGLRDAGGAAARRALEGLADDGDKVVREAALRALALTARAATAHPET